MSIGNSVSDLVRCPLLDAGGGAAPFPRWLGIVAGVCNPQPPPAVILKHDVDSEAATPEAGLDVPQCVRRVRLGDEDAAAALLTHLYPLVIKLVRSHLPRRSSEEDLVQTVFMKIFSKLEQYSGRVPLEHWVSRIAVNTCLNQIDRERVRPEIRWADLSEAEEQLLQSIVAGADAAELTEQAAARELVAKVLAALKPADRLVVSLLHLEGRSVAEVRQATGWSESLVKIRAFRARRKMKKHLEALLKKDGA
jgi:RNA polymerase sigma-70 factor (ECF subfamily)